METKTKIVEKYLVYDKEFDSKAEAKKYALYIEKLLSKDYYEVSIRPDCNEGKGYKDKIIISSNENSLNPVYHYLLRYGYPIVPFRETHTVENYHLSKKLKFESYEELKWFLNKEVSFGIEGYMKTLKAVYVKENGEGETLNLDEVNEEVIKKDLNETYSEIYSGKKIPLRQAFSKTQ